MEGLHAVPATGAYFGRVEVLEQGAGLGAQLLVLLHQLRGHGDHLDVQLDRYLHGHAHVRGCAPNGAQAGRDDDGPLHAVAHEGDHLCEKVLRYVLRLVSEVEDGLHGEGLGEVHHDLRGVEEDAERVGGEGGGAVRVKHLALLVGQAEYLQ